MELGGVLGHGYVSRELVWSMRVFIVLSDTLQSCQNKKGIFPKILRIRGVLGSQLFEISLESNQHPGQWLISGAC